MFGVGLPVMSQPAQLPPTQLITTYVCHSDDCRYRGIIRTDRAGVAPDGFLRVPTVYCGGCGAMPVETGRELS